MKEYLTDLISAALGSAGIPVEASAIQFEKPKQSGHGDLATNVAMVLAKQEKRNPRDLATLIKDHLATHADASRISAVEIAGPGFINFRFADGYLHDALRSLISDGARFGRSDEFSGKTVNVEWVSANPTGPLHAGHGRQVCIGATLCALLEWTGWSVTREYYFNNAGNQMNNLGLSVRARYRELCGEAIDESEVQYAGGYIRDIAASIHAVHGDTKSSEDVAFFRKAGEEWCFALIRTSLDALAVHHDIFFNEDSLYTDGKIDQVLADFRTRGLIYDSEGAVWLKTTAFGADKDRVIVKNTGEPTYRLPDIAYHKDKVLRGYDKIIDIFGADHIATIPDVLAGINALGLRTDHIDVVIHQMVSFVNEGEAMRMSKRSGNVYSLDDLIQDVGADAVRYFFVMRGANAHLEFDLKLAQEQSENNPVYYLQYAHARIASILRFAESEGLETGGTDGLSLLAHPAETALIKVLLEFPAVVRHCASSYEIHHLCTYLHGVATEFHRFYHECRVVTEDRELSRSRLALCHATKQVLANGFAILGINAPERM